MKQEDSIRKQKNIKNKAENNKNKAADIRRGYGFCDFSLGETDQRAKPADIKNCSPDKIIVRELNEFGHTYEAPKGILKMNILQD